MLALELLDYLDTSESDKEVLIEINGVQHAVHEVRDSSQGIVLFVDTDQEEREMR